MTTHDFTKKNCRWGHNILGASKIKNSERYSSLLISSVTLEEGDILRLGSDQGIMTAKVTKVTPQGNPKDLYEVEFEFTNVSEGKKDDE